MIRFDNWAIQADGEILARQFDNLTRTLTVTGDIPTGWEWAVLVQVKDFMDIIPLTATGGTLSAVLTAQQLSIAGYYNMQLRATQGDKVQHTNTVNVYIPASLSGDEQWPTVPSEFSDMERRIDEKAKQVEGYSIHPPTVGENGNWWEWDGEAYVDTGKSSRGEQGVQGEQGEPGAQGPQGLPGEPGEPGEDAYTKAVEKGFQGTKAEFYQLLAKAKDFLRTDTIVDWAINNMDEWTPFFGYFNIARVQKMGYKGTGTFGEENARKLTFDFQPKLVIVVAYDKVHVDGEGTEKVNGFNEVLMVAPYGTPAAVSSRYYGSGDIKAYPTHLTWNGKTVSWWGTTKTQHLNCVRQYYVLAIG